MRWRTAGRLLLILGFVVSGCAAQTQERFSTSDIKPPHESMPKHQVAGWEIYKGNHYCFMSRPATKGIQQVYFWSAIRSQPVMVMIIGHEKGELVFDELDYEVSYEFSNGVIGRKVFSSDFSDIFLLPSGIINISKRRHYYAIWDNHFVRSFSQSRSLKISAPPGRLTLPIDGFKEASDSMYECGKRL